MGRPREIWPPGGHTPADPRCPHRPLGPPPLPPLLLVPPPSLHPLDKPEPRSGPGWLPHAPELLSRLRILGSLSDPASKRRMTVLTTCPGVQLYTNFGYPPLAAGSTVCLETGYPPDTANTAFNAGGGVAVERSLLRVGEERCDLTCHCFEWKEKKWKEEGK